DFTLEPPAGFTIDNSGMVGPGIAEWNGWSFADRDFWAQAGGQDRAAFTLASGTVAVADSDEFDDVENDTAFASLLQTPAIILSDVAENSVTLEFDSSFRPEGDQRGFVDVTFDGGETWTNILTLDTQDERNNNYSFDIANPASGEMELRFSYTGDNNWWWAI
ncbi:MAG TPA: nucleotide pyrophosphatase, partial [Planctomycetaceae bacterium]|nr:nucleotide pyrophosphatase [Planctomycetaceae bacterium]